MKRTMQGVTYRPVADLLVDVVRGGVVQVGEQKAEVTPLVQQLLAERGGHRAGRIRACAGRAGCTRS